MDSEKKDKKKEKDKEKNKDKDKEKDKEKEKNKEKNKDKEKDKNKDKKKEKDKDKKKAFQVDTEDIVFSSNPRHGLINLTSDDFESPGRDQSDDDKLEEKSKKSTETETKAKKKSKEKISEDDEEITKRDKKKEKTEDQKKKGKEEPETEIMYNGAPYGLVECVHLNGIDPLKMYILKHLADFMTTKEYNEIQFHQGLFGTTTAQDLYDLFFIQKEQESNGLELFKAFLKKNTFKENASVEVMLCFETMMKYEKTDFKRFMTQFYQVVQYASDTELDISCRSRLVSAFDMHWDSGEIVDLTEEEKKKSAKCWQRKEAGLDVDDFEDEEADGEEGGANAEKEKKKKKPKDKSSSKGEKSKKSDKKKE